MAEPNETGDATRQRFPLLITADELAALIHRSVSSIERDERAGRIPPAVRIGRHRRWLLEAVIAWINQGCPKLGRRREEDDGKSDAN